MSRPREARLQGLALVVYFVLLPLVVVARWHRSEHLGDGDVVRALLVALSALWLCFFVQVLRNMVRLHRGREVTGGGSAWLAGLVLAAVALLVPVGHTTTRSSEVVALRAEARPSSPHGGSSPVPAPLPDAALGAGGLPLALMSKRRFDLLRRDETDDVEESLELLRAANPNLVAHLARRAASRLDGVIEMDERDVVGDAPAPSTPVVACVLASESSRTRVGFAHEGGRLPVPASWGVAEIESGVVALHDGPVVFAHNEAELLRRLAVRARRPTVVVYLGDARSLDDEIAACAVTVTAYVEDDARRPPAARTPWNDATTLDHGGAVVELLRAEPRVRGLVEPFAATLRRRCVEMTAYLALHRHEPVTGERLRTRVLARADVDASQRTLANTASAVRRSLGVDERGPRLHPVTSSGLYETHGVSSDLERFSNLVTRARHSSAAESADLAHEALLLVQGEPLASALRGFEWFLAEGHAARLARDGEWAALALHHVALERRHYELAFWALQQGLLIDPYSDALAEARGRVPRLREFGRDGARRAQDRAVGAGDAVAMSWAFARFRQQVSQ